MSLKNVRLFLHFKTIDKNVINDGNKYYDKKIDSLTEASPEMEQLKKKSQKI